MQRVCESHGFGTARGEMARVIYYLFNARKNRPFLQYPCCLGSQAVDTPISVSVRIADGNRKSAKVGTNHLNGGGWVRAGQIHEVTLTLVSCQVSGSIRCLTWKRKNSKLLLYVGIIGWIDSMPKVIGDQHGGTFWLRWPFHQD